MKTDLNIYNLVSEHDDAQMIKMRSQTKCTGIYWVPSLLDNIRCLKSLNFLSFHLYIDIFSSNVLVVAHLVVKKTNYNKYARYRSAIGKTRVSQCSLNHSGMTKYISSMQYYNFQRNTCQSTVL